MENAQSSLRLPHTSKTESKFLLGFVIGLEQSVDVATSRVGLEKQQKRLSLGPKAFSQHATFSSSLMLDVLDIDEDVKRLSADSRRSPKQLSANSCPKRPSVYSPSAIFASLSFRSITKWVQIAQSEVGFWFSQRSETIFR